ncbi:MAG: peptidoglycan-N-acetylmuramic acid deacetylase [Eubacteriales bacterium]|nr:peptidoglycan-N-acetylmuramic acid deacetylase [Eubacteriales bacterium]MDN5364461.1 peptidoglycan-N-acetylmuramic acid deacetylase [Eubacteriales bacterium]
MFGKRRYFYLHFLLIGISIFLLAGVLFPYLVRNFSSDVQRRPVAPRKDNRVAVEQEEGPSLPSAGAVQGWGFVPGKNGQPPQITEEQRQILQKYGAVFMGKPASRRIALTFDMGYEEPRSTEQVLKVLRKHRVKGAFFTTAYWLEKNPALARKIVQEGHILANHSVNHPSMPSLNEAEMKEEILGWQRLAEKITGQKGFKYFRPPRGEYDERSLAVTRQLGYTTVFWSVAIVDWQPLPGGPEQMVKEVMEQIHPGAIVLLHPKSQDVRDGLDRLIQEIKKKGLQPVSLEEVLR